MQRDTPVFDRQYQQLIGASNRYFGLFGTYSLLLAVFIWWKGEATLRSAALIAGLPVANLFASKVILRIKSARPSQLEVFRLSINAMVLPVVYVGLEGPLSPWWPSYFVFALSSVLAIGLSSSSRRAAQMSVVFWAVHAAVVSILFRDRFEAIQSAYLVGALLMVGFVSMSWMTTIKDSIDREIERTEELKREQARILLLHQELEVQRAKSTQSSKMAALGEMAGGMAHEVNNPLAVIRATIGMLRDQLADGVLEQKALDAQLGTIERTTVRIANIVQGLRNVSRNAEGDPLVGASLREIVKDTLALCQERFRGEGVEIETELPSEARIECRPAQISQVILNLLSNAFDAVRGGGRGSWIRLELREQESEVLLRVSDGGRGIPPGILDKIFQPFFTTKEIGKGTGLGLSVSKGIVESHRGTLEVDTGAANTTFVLSLPRAMRAGGPIRLS